MDKDILEFIFLMLILGGFFAFGHLLHRLMHLKPPKSDVVTRNDT